MKSSNQQNGSHDNGAGLRRMRRIATGALIVCAVGAVICRVAAHFGGVSWLGWPGAFFEAGMVGAMADWFAVVALFRHPMGLPIPHTAILPNNKDRVAESLATFMETSFLTEEQLGPRFRGIDYAGFASRWLEENAAMLAARAVGFAPVVVGGLSDVEMVDLLKERARDLIRKAELGPMVGTGLEVMVQNGRDREIFMAVLTSARQLLEEHQTTIQAKIREEIPIPEEFFSQIPIFGKELVGPMLGQFRDQIAGMVARKTIEKVQAALDEAAEDSDSALWRSFDQRLHGLIDDLKSSPEMAERLHSMQETLAASGVVEDFARAVWYELKAFLLRDCMAEDSLVRRKIEEAMRTAAQQIGENEAVRKELNAFVGEQVLAYILEARPHARELVVSTIQKWDAKEMTTRLEGTVGRDLQFIRLNGTIVGGLVGVLIYGVFRGMGV